MTAFQALERVWVTLTWACARGLASAQAATGRAFSLQRILPSKSSRIEPQNRGRDALPRAQADRQVGPTTFMGRVLYTKTTLADSRLAHPTASNGEPIRSIHLALREDFPIGLAGVGVGGLRVFHLGGFVKLLLL